MDASLASVDEAEAQLFLRDEVRAKSGEAPDEGSASAAPSSSKLQVSARIAKKFIQALFTTVTSLETLILTLGSLSAVIHGMIFPFVAIIFGSMTNLFIQQSIKGYANDSTTGVTTSGNFIADNFTSTSESGGDTLSKLGQISGAGLFDKVFGGVLDLVNKVVLRTFSEQQILTREEFIHNVAVTGKLFCFLAVLVFVTSFLQALCWEWVAVNQKYALRESVLRRILRRNLSWFAVHDVGELISNVFNEVARVREAIGFQFCRIIQCLAMFVASSMLAFLISWRMALVFLSPVPVLLLRALTLGEKVGSASNEARVLADKAEEVQSESLQKLDTVVAFGQQQAAIVEFGTKLETSVDVFFRKFHLTALGRAIIFICIYGSYAGAFWYGCRLLLQHQITPGEIYAIFLAATMATVALAGMFGSITVVGNAYGAAVHLHDFGMCHDDSQIDNPDKDGKKKLNGSKFGAEAKGEIEFEAVNFSYPTGATGVEQPEVLHDLSFKVPAGKTVVIYADAGQGKTTIAKLLLRLYDTTAGTIRLDGVDIKELPVKWLRSQIDIASQHEQLISGESVDESILAGRKTPPNMKLNGFNLSERLEEVKALVDPSGELKSLTRVDVSRLPVSAKQKINLARSLLMNPPILILDHNVFELLLRGEGGSIKDKILEARKGKTTILLSNDVFDTNNREFELVYWLENGHIPPENIGSYWDLYGNPGPPPPDPATSSRFYKMFEDAKNKQRFSVGNMEFAEPEPTSECVPEESGQATEEQKVGLLALYEVGSSECKLFGLGFVGCVLCGAQFAVFAFYFVEIFATFSKTGSELSSDAVFWSGMLVLLALLAAVGVWLRVLFMSAAAMYLLLRIRTTAFASIIRRPKFYYDPLIPKMTPEMLGARVLFAVPSIRNMLEFSFPELLSTAVTLAIVSVIVCALVWQIGIILVAGVFILLSILAFCLFKTQRMAQDFFQAIDAGASSVILRGVDVIELIQTFVMQDYWLQKYADVTQPAVRRAHIQSVVFSVLYALCETVIFAFFGVSFLYGSQLISSGNTEPGSLFKIFFAMAICIVSFSQTVSLMPALAKAAGDLQWITNIVREEGTLDSSLDALNEEGDELEEQPGQNGVDIEFRDVYFEYQMPGGAEPCKVLNGLSIHIEPGTTTALTHGQLQGAGEVSIPFGGTTILNLIQRFYDVTSGELLINGKNIKGLNIGALRRHIGWVSQHPAFFEHFEGSVADNLKYGNDELSGNSIDDTVLTNMLGKMGLDDQFGPTDLHTFRTEEYWEKLPRGTTVRLALARALLRRPWILLLDSPTSTMSPEETEAVENVLRTVLRSGEQTAVMVTNVPSTLDMGRLETIQNGQCRTVTSFSACM